MKHHIPAAIALILGIALSFAAYRTVDIWEKKEINHEFEVEANNLSAALQLGIDSHFEVLYFLRAFYEGSNNVERSEFTTFLEGSLERHSGFQAIEWIPRVPAAERDLYESLAQADSFEDFRITELGQDGIVSVSEREEYFPVFYMEPIEGNEAALGFDLGSDPSRLAALIEARDSGELAVTRRITLVQETGDQYGFLAFVPVYRTDAATDTLADPQANLEGFVLGVFRIRDLVNTSIKGLDLGGIGMELHDLSASESEEHLVHASTQMPDGSLCVDEEMNKGCGMVWVDSFDVGGREWSLECFHTEEFMKTQTTWTKWGVLIVGLVFTVMLTIYLVIFTIKRLELEHSIANRERAEKELEHRMHDLGERYKELNCIHTIAKLASQQGITLEKMVQGTVMIIPWSWQYTDIVCARITLEQSTFTTENFRESQWRQAADINIDGKKFGMVEVFYLEERKDLFEGPFLKEERDLIDSIAGNVGGFIERRRVEDEIKLQKGILESIFEASPMGIFLVDAETRRIVQSNALGLKMLGLPEEECLNGNCHQSIWNEKEATCPIFDLNQDNCEKEAWVRRPDGTEKKIVENAVKVLINDEPHVLVVLTDVTEREKALQESARLASIVQQATENILITDIDGVIEYVNPAFEMASGYQAQEVIGLPAIELLAEKENESIIEAIQTCMRNGVPWSGRLTRKKKDGSSYEAEESVFPVKGPKGETINSVSIGRDVTEQLGLERQLRQAQKLESIGQLAAGIAHEINTPMQYVGDNTQFLKESFTELIGLINKYSETVETADQGEIDREMLREIEKLSKEADVDFMTEEIPQAIEQSLDGIQRVSEIVRAMKDFSHPGSEDKVVTDLNKAITSTITVARNEWKYVSELETDLDESLPGVPCYPGEVNQVILNLITNAAYAIGRKLGDHPTQKGKITISTRQDGNSAEIRVADTGGGIPEDIGERVFDPFFTTKGVGKGTGQGLSIAHAVIKDKHGGTITFETAQGEGTTFVIRLPLDPDQAEEEKTAVAVEQVEREE